MLCCPHGRWFKGCINQQFLSGSCHCHIQTSVSAFLVHRSEIHAHMPLFIRSVTKGKNNHIPLITLNIFKIFDEQWRIHPGNRFMEGRILVHSFLQPVINQPSLLNVQGHHANGLILSGHDTPLKFIHNSFCLCFIGSCPGTIINTTYIDKLNS